MASSVVVNGKTIYKPGILGKITADALGGKGLVVGRVAVVGDFPALQAATPTQYNSAQQLAALDPKNRDLARIARLAFSPSLDDAVPGGASDLTLLNVQPNTQASYTLKDSAGADSLKISSRLWGTRGNAVLAEIEQNSVDPKTVDVHITRDGDTEKFLNVGSGDLATVYYDGADLTSTTLDVDPGQFKLSWGLLSTALPGAGLPNKNTNAVTDLIINSTTVAATLSVVTPVGQSTTVKITGKNELGVATVETLTFGPGEGAVPKVTTVKWSEITEVETDSDDGAYAGKSSVAGVSFNLVVADYASLKDLLAAAHVPGKGYYAEGLSPIIGHVPADEIDKQAGVDVFSGGAATATATLRADLWSIAATLTNASELVTAARSTAAALPPKHFGTAGPPAKESVLLAGGTAAATALIDWIAGFVLLESLNIQIVSAFSDSAAVIAELVNHCKNAALAGFERNGWAGAVKDQTPAQIYTGYTSFLNSRHVSLVGASIRVAGASGNLEWLGPKYHAIQCMGMQAGTDVATPLTNKRPAVYDVSQNWAAADEDDVIQKGICALTKDTIGWKILRSVTTYMTDDNPVYSEMSANESVNTSIRSLRADLLIKIGAKSITLSPSRLAATVEGLLAKQVTDGIIKAFRNVVIQDLGDTYSIDYEAAPVEPINFILLNLAAVRIAA